MSFESENPQRLLVCPYDNVHSIMAFRMIRHLQKCSRNHYEEAKNKVTCGFNNSHIIPAIELSGRESSHQSMHIKTNIIPRMREMRNNAPPQTTSASSENHKPDYYSQEPSLMMHEKLCPDRGSFDHYTRRIERPAAPVIQEDAKPKVKCDGEWDIAPPIHGSVLNVISKQCEKKRILRSCDTISSKSERKVFQQKERERLKKLNNEEIMKEEQALSDTESGITENSYFTVKSECDSIQSDNSEIDGPLQPRGRGSLRNNECLGQNKGVGRGLSLLGSSSIGHGRGVPLRGRMTPH